MKTRPVPLATVAKEAESLFLFSGFLRRRVCISPGRGRDDPGERHEGGGVFTSYFEAFFFEKQEHVVLSCSVTSFSFVGNFKK